MDACSARVGLEPLEIRLLLSATSADDPAPLQSPVAAVEVDIEPGLRTQTITWQGESIDAAADRWVLRYDPRKLNVKMLERRLKKMRIQGASVTVLGQKGFALLE